MATKLAKGIGIAPSWAVPRRVSLRNEVGERLRGAWSSLHLTAGGLTRRERPVLGYIGGTEAELVARARAGFWRQRAAPREEAMLRFMQVAGPMR